MYFALSFRDFYRSAFPGARFFNFDSAFGVSALILAGAAWLMRHFELAARSAMSAGLREEAMHLTHSFSTTLTLGCGAVLGLMASAVLLDAWRDRENKHRYALYLRTQTPELLQRQILDSRTDALTRQAIVAHLSANLPEWVSELPPRLDAALLHADRVGRLVTQEEVGKRN